MARRLPTDDQTNVFLRDARLDTAFVHLERIGVFLAHARQRWRTRVLRMLGRRDLPAAEAVKVVDRMEYLCGRTYVRTRELQHTLRDLLEPFLEERDRRTAAPPLVSDAKATGPLPTGLDSPSQLSRRVPTVLCGPTAALYPALARVAQATRAQVPGLRGLELRAVADPYLPCTGFPQRDAEDWREALAGLETFRRFWKRECLLQRGNPDLVVAHNMTVQHRPIPAPRMRDWAYILRPWLLRFRATRAALLLGLPSMENARDACRTLKNLATVFEARLEGDGRVVLVDMEGREQSLEPQGVLS